VSRLLVTDLKRQLGDEKANCLKYEELMNVTIGEQLQYEKVPGLGETILLTYASVMENVAINIGLCYSSITTVCQNLFP